MGNTKTVFKFFTIPQYQQEEMFLSEMHEKGWRFNHVVFPGFYQFTKCEPEQVTYRLDYNQEGISNKSEYIQMFSDCGWEYIEDFVGYSYFRKKGQIGEEREEIFCDDDSRLDMMKRVFRGRIIPLIILFALVIIPQLFVNTAGYGRGGGQEVVSFALLGLAILYLGIFIVTACQFYRYEKKVYGDSSGVQLKYLGLFALITSLIIGVGVLFWSSYHSVYEVTDRENGYVLEAEQLNTSLVKEYLLKKGDTIFFLLNCKTGHLHLDVAQKGKESVFLGDFYDIHGNDPHTIEIQEDGHYLIEIEGRHFQGDVEVVIR